MEHIQVLLLSATGARMLHVPPGLPEIRVPACQPPLVAYTPGVELRLPRLADRVFRAIGPWTYEEQER